MVNRGEEEVWVQMNVVPRSTGNTNSGTRELTLKCKSKSSPTFSVRPCSSVGRVTVDLIRRSWVRFPPRSKDFFFASCGSLFPLLGLTPSGLFMGLKSSTLIYTSELILWFHYLCFQCYAAQHSFLPKYGIDSSSLKWFESYLCDRNQKCSTNGHLSNTAPVSCGVPQGPNLGPLLFLVYISDLPNCLNSASPRIFADYTNITFAASTMIDLENAVIKLRTKKSSALAYNQ